MRRLVVLLFFLLLLFLLLVLFLFLGEIFLAGLTGLIISFCHLHHLLLLCRDFDSASRPVIHRTVCFGCHITKACGRLFPVRLH